MSLNAKTWGQTTSQIAKNTIKSTVSIIALDQLMQPIALGSGAIVDDNSVVTNYHVVKGATKLKLIFDGQANSIITTTYYSVDYDNDLILLKIEPTMYPSIPIVEQDSSDIGDRIFVAGNPKGLSGTFSEGIISGKREFNKRKLLQITAPISPGSSGGPVVNSAGKLIGISVGSFKEGQNLNFAIPATYVINLLNSKEPQELKTILHNSKEQKENEITSNVIDAVIVKNVSIFTYAYDYYVSYSVINNLDKSISDLKILLLIVNKQGEVKDYEEIDILTTSKYFKSESILPNLTKTFRHQLTGVGKPIESVMSSKDKIVIKVLDFKIADE